MVLFKVRATLGSSGNKRRVDSRCFRKKSIAQKFADDTNRDRPGARALVVKCPKKKK